MHSTGSSIASPAPRPLGATTFATSAHLFCARLCYPGKPFVMAFPREQQEAFFEANCQTLDHWDGVPKRLVYYNTAWPGTLPTQFQEVGNGDSNLRVVRWFNRGKKGKQ